LTGSISTVETPQGRISTRHLLLAAGAQTSELIERVTGAHATAERFAVRRVPGLLVETPPGSAPDGGHRVLYPPDRGGLHLRPTYNGGLLLGADDTDALFPAESGSAPPSLPNETLLQRAAASLLERACQALPGLSLATLRANATHRICTRPVP